MKTNDDIIKKLNHLLIGELTAVDVYLVQSQICRNWGYGKLCEHFAHEMTDEIRHAELLVRRILFLGGSPELTVRSACSVGATVEDMLIGDLALENDVAKNLIRVIAECDVAGDYGSRKILEELLVDTEQDHIFWLESQIKQINQLGLDGYLQQQI